MLISKFDLYKTGWLDLVFDDRNKSYGAYELRQHYPRTMVKAMLITFLSIGGITFIAGVIIKPVVTAAAPVVRVIPVKFIQVIHPPVLQPPSHSTPHVRPALPSAAINIAHPSIPVVTIDNQATLPIKLNTTVDPAPVDIAGPGNIGPISTPGTGGPGITSAPSTEVHSTIGLERMPEPYGGAGAWNKFLQKNLRYPDMAADQHASGAVWVSFIVEADGKLSNIKVQRGAGFGMDEEAVRVLKSAPAWKPGIQNGQPVRVSYNIPIRFVLGDDNN